MAELERKDLISDEALGVFGVLSKDILQAAAALDQIVKSGKSIDANISGAKSFKQVRLESEKLSVSQKELQKQTKAIEQAQAKLNPEYQKGQKDLVKLRLAQQASTQKMKEQARETSGLTTLYQKQSARLNRLRNSYKDLELQNKGNTREARALKREIQTLDTRLKKVDASVGQYQRSVGNYASAWKGVGNVLRSAGLIGGIAGVVMVMKDAFKKVKQFQQANADLASVIGKTRKDIEALTKDAIRLGSATKFTATEVAGLQKEFAKLGFTEQEILNVTEATLQLAAATNSDLAEAASVAGSTIRAFGLNSYETQRVVDVMAKSFSSSALDMQKFSTAMGSVAPVAKSAGVSLERTTALLGVLVDNGIDASTAGTGLRNVFLRLAETGLTYEEALGKIQRATDKNAIALELFGTRGATIGTILADNTEKVGALEKKLGDVGGVAKQMAEEQLNTLEGKLTLLSSAYDGFILALENGEGPMAKFFISAIELTTDLLNNMIRLTKSVSQFQNEKIEELVSQSAKDEIERLVKNFKRYKEEWKGTDTIQNIAQQRIDKHKEELVALEDLYKTRLRRELELRELFASGDITGKQAEELEMITKQNDASLIGVKVKRAEIKALEDYIKQTQKATEVIDTNTEALEDNNKAVAKSKETSSVDSIDDLPNIGGILQDQDEFKDDADKRVELLKKHLEKIEESERISYKHRMEDLKDFQQQRLAEIGENFLEASLDLYSARVEGRIQALELENEEYQRIKNEELEFAEGNEERQAAIQEQIAAKEEATRKKVNKLRRKQAIAEKAMAITQTVINTALAITQAFAQLGPIAGIPVAVALGALGAVQTATIIAQPIPQFAMGTDFSPEGHAIINEQGPELMEKDGKKFMVNSDGPTLTYLQRGTKIHTAQETQEMLSRSAIQGLNFVNPIEKKESNKEIISELKEVKRAIRKQKGANVSVYGNERWMKIITEDYA